MFTRPIHIGLSPNLQFDDVMVTLKVLLKPGKWKSGEATSKVESWFSNYFNSSLVVSFNAGRSALLAILKSLDLKQGSEVMVQAFTCVAVPNSVIWAGYKPVFVDINETLNIDVNDARKKLSKRTKAIIVQHTFGVPADMDNIVKFCQKHNLLLIEDCAHALGARYNGRLVGTFGEATMFSFGRDKIISSVFGGLAITNNKSIGKKLANYNEQLSYPSYFWLLQQLLHPLISYISLYLYEFFNIGKALLYISQKLKVISFPNYDKEKRSVKPDVFPKKYPNGLALLLINQLKKIENYNKHRQVVAKLYFVNLDKRKYKLPNSTKESIYLRFNVFTSHAGEAREWIKDKGIILGNWYARVIDPKGVDIKRLCYKRDSCPKAEIAATKCLNLPTYPHLSREQVKLVCQILNKK